MNRDEQVEIKVIINSGIVIGVLSNGYPRVEIVDIDPDYDDFDELKKYVESLYDRPDLSEKEFTVKQFDTEG